MGRGRHAATVEKMEKCYDVALERHPISVRGVAYPLFNEGLIPSMAKGEVDKVGTLLRVLREEGTVPWEWIVDNKHVVRRYPAWNSPAEYLETMLHLYRKAFWTHQPVRVAVWSEKDTVSGVLQPVLDTYRVPFLPVGGYGSATRVHEAAVEADDESTATIILYVGDADPSGMSMSERDLPRRFAEYSRSGHYHSLVIRRLVLRPEDGLQRGLLRFPVADKRKDPRYKWWCRQDYGDWCYELDAIDPRELRTIVADAILEYLDLDAWDRCVQAEAADIAAMRAFFQQYPGISMQAEE